MAIYLGTKKVSMRGIVIDNSKLAQVVDRSVTEITAKDLKGVTKIGVSAFYYCTNLTSITISNSVKSINNEGFYGCDALITVEFEENSQLTSIGNDAFSSCDNLANITIPDSVKSIGNYAFNYCGKLTSVQFGENSQLTSIGREAFYSTAITSITIPASVTSLGTRALEIGKSTNKATIRMLGSTPPTIQSTTIGSNVAKIIVPKGCLEAYQTATNWSAKASIMEEAAE